MKIGSREVGPGAPVFVIAEAGVNHEPGDVASGVELIARAAEAGADAVKFQFFKVDQFIVPRSYAEEIRRLEIPDDWLPRLRKAAAENGLAFLCTSFDRQTFDAVEPFVDAYKVGSYEAADAAFLDYAMAHRKPTIASTGLGLPLHRRPDVTLRCVSQYPARLNGYLRGPLPEEFWGVSDHTIDPITVPSAAVALGAVMVEKHFHRSADDGCIDHRVSILPEDFKRMVSAVRLTEKAVRG